MKYLRLLIFTGSILFLCIYWMTKQTNNRDEENFKFNPKLKNERRISQQVYPFSRLIKENKIQDKDEEGFSNSVKTKYKQKIFFIDTSCVFNNTKEEMEGSRDGGLILNPRECCSIYSAATLHPNREVLIHYTCSLSSDYYQRSSNWVKSVLDLPNVLVVSQSKDPKEWFHGSLAEGLEVPLSTSPYRVVHSSDALRILLLWKNGGTYMDFDILLLKNLDDLGDNWGGTEYEGSINNAFINFSEDEIGRGMASSMLGRMTKKYFPTSWITLGPELLSNTIAKLCKVHKESFGTRGRMKCGFNALPMAAFYPIPLERFKDLFRKKGKEWVERQIKISHAVHLWNSSSKKVQVESGSAYDALAKRLCSPVIKSTPGQTL